MHHLKNTLVVFCFVLVSTKNLDSGKPFNTILTTKRLVFVCINCPNFHNTLEERKAFKLEKQDKKLHKEKAKYVLLSSHMCTDLGQNNRMYHFTHMHREILALV